jgi:ribonuclease-3
MATLLPPTEQLCRRLDYAFRDPARLELALTHSSFANEQGVDAQARDRLVGAAHNERLEFLGDAVLDFVISDLLMEGFPQLAEGQLSKLRAALVTESSLAQIARDLGLGALLRMGRGEALSGGREKNSILSDTLEALLAAVYLDSREQEGVAAAGRVIHGLFAGRIEQVQADAPFYDYKTQLQEWVQKTYREGVTYRIVTEGGPDHAKTFEAAVSIQDREYGRGQGRNKKQAEQAAARAALEALQARPTGYPQ